MSIIPTRVLPLPPGIILVGATSLDSEGITYSKLNEREEAESTSEGTKRKVVTTKMKTVRAEEELAATKVVLNEIKAGLREVTRATLIGYFCPRKDEAALDAFISKAKTLAARHNATARYHFVKIPYVKAYLAPSDEAAAREIAGQLRSCVTDVVDAINNADPVKIRSAILRLKGLAPVVNAEEGSVLGEAIKSARNAATIIQREVKKKGEDIAKVKSELNLDALDRARAMCLEFEVPAEIAAIGTAGTEERGMELDAAASEPIVPVPTPAQDGQTFEMDAAAPIPIPVEAQSSGGFEMAPEAPPQPVLPPAPVLEPWQTSLWWLSAMPWCETGDIAAVQQTAINAVVHGLNTGDLALVDAIILALPEARHPNLTQIRQRAIAAVAQVRGQGQEMK